MPDFNSPKNPLPDLMPLEEGRSTEVSSQELSAIRASLMETSWRTEQIVDVLERNNILLERDLEKITNLKRRLRRSIGIIPGMPGKAGALFGAGVGMGLILPFGFKWPDKSPDIPPIGKPQPPLTPVPDPVFVPVDVPQPVPVDVPQPIPVDVPQPVPGDVTVPGDVPNPGGIINWPEIPLIPGLYPEGEDLGQGLGQDIFNPNALPTPSFAFSEGMNFNWDTFLDTQEVVEQPDIGKNWVDDLSPKQVWEILKANLGKPIVWKILAVAGVSAALLFIPFDGQALSVLGSIKVLSMLKYAIAAGLLIIPPTIAPAGATETSNLNNSNLNINNSIGDFSTSSSDIASLQLNTRKTDTFVIITDQPIA